jgi:transcriptional regulator with XRE-family HTH domain
MDMGQAIRKLRAARSLSQEELAHRCGTTAANISRIETGKHNASATLIRKLATEFSLDLYQLVALAEGVENPAPPPSISSPDERQVLDCYRAMTSDRKALLKAVAAIFARSA